MFYFSLKTLIVLLLDAFNRLNTDLRSWCKLQWTKVQPSLPGNNAFDQSINFHITTIIAS